jgi:hypothetical protein
LRMAAGRAEAVAGSDGVGMAGILSTPSYDRAAAGFQGHAASRAHSLTSV